MKKNFSVFMLSARYMLWPALIVAVLAAGGTYWRLSSALAAEQVMDARFFDAAGIVVNLAVTLLCLLLMFPLRERGGVQPGYTLRRLRVSELAAFLWQGLAAAAAIFVVLMAVTAVCFFYGLRLQKAGLGEAGELSLLVSFVSSGVTHALLPLGDWPVYIRMAAVLYTLGAAAVPEGCAAFADGSEERTLYTSGYSAATRTYYHAAYEAPAILAYPLDACDLSGDAPFFAEAAA